MMKPQYTTLELVESLIEQVEAQQNQINALTSRVEALETGKQQAGM